jgi:DNA-binding CsgD family transcriptional regulator
VLTNAERRIAILAASGNTNREIAKQLFVTSSTVEQHLTRVFRKLKLKHREELPAGLGLQVLDNA